MTPPTAYDDAMRALHVIEPDNPVREAAERIMSQRGSVENVRTLVKVLDRTRGRPRWRERLVAAYALGFAGSDSACEVDAVVPLCSVIRGTSEPHSPALVCAALAVGAAFILMASASESMRYRLLADPLFGATVALLTVAAPFIIKTALSAHARWQAMCRAVAAEALGKIGAPASAASLAGAALQGSAEAAAALHSVLTNVSEEHYGDLPVDTVPELGDLLLDCLHSTDAAWLCEAILDALGRIGDERSLRAVETAARSGQSEEVQAAALAALPAIEDRARRARDSASLLRAAHNPAEPTRVLLRPAGSGAPTDPLLLVRPAPGEPDRRAESNSDEP